MSGSAFWLGDRQLTIDARVLPNGQVEGTQTWVRSDGSVITSGPVLEVVPPSTEVDYWCISARRAELPEGTPPQNVNWYVRDSGDGVTTFDEVGNLLGFPELVNCTDARQAPAVVTFIPVTEGDFKGNY